MAFLGTGEMDQFGNVNVSNLGKRIPGTGGFVDISQNAKTVVFCGTFTNGDIKTEAGDGKLQDPSGRGREEIREECPPDHLQRRVFRSPGPEGALT